MRFMVDVHIDVAPERGPEARALLPAENARVAADLQSGALEAIYYEEATPPTHIWAIMRADSLEAVQRTVETYPLAAFFRTTYTPLRE
jgi:Muconolactone delta-isomerase